MAPEERRMRSNPTSAGWVIEVLLRAKGGFSQAILPKFHVLVLQTALLSVVRRVPKIGEDNLGMPGVQVAIRLKREASVHESASCLEMRVA